MLIKDYYTLNEIVTQADTTMFRITLRPDSTIYHGHFPGSPVSPGVCNIQLIKECAEHLCGKPLFMHNLQQCRLTTLVTPLEHADIEVTIQLEPKGDVYKLKATLGKADQVYLELKAELTPESTH